MNQNNRRNRIPPINPREIQKQNLMKRELFIATIPMRLVKATAGFVFFIPLTMLAFGGHCFKANEWPWSGNI